MTEPCGVCVCVFAAHRGRMVGEHRHIYVYVGEEDRQDTGGVKDK